MANTITKLQISKIHALFVVVVIIFANVVIVVNKSSFLSTSLVTAKQPTVVGFGFGTFFSKSRAINNNRVDTIPTQKCKIIETNLYRSWRSSPPFQRPSDTGANRRECISVSVKPQPQPQMAFVPTHRQRGSIPSSQHLFKSDEISQFIAISSIIYYQAEKALCVHNPASYKNIVLIAIILCSVLLLDRLSVLWQRPFMQMFQIDLNKTLHPPVLNNIKIGNVRVKSDHKNQCLWHYSTLAISEAFPIDRLHVVKPFDSLTTVSTTS